MASQLSLATASQKLWTSHLATTPTRLKLVDAYLAFVLMSGILLFVHCVLVGTFPYNAFLAAFASTVGSFVLAGSLFWINFTFLLIVPLLIIQIIVILWCFSESAHAIQCREQGRVWKCFARTCVCWLLFLFGRSPLFRGQLYRMIEQ